MKTHIKTLLQFILITSIFYRCANPVGPTGGDKDIQAPKIKNIKISTIGSKKNIIIFFDENINTKGNPLISPSKNKKNITLEKERNSVSIQVPKETNSIQLLDVISDVNENNIGNYPAIILGKDSSKFIFKYKPKEKQKIKGFAPIDSNIYPANSSFKGKVIFEGIPKNTKWLMVYDDINNNDNYEFTEPYFEYKPKVLFNYNDTIKDTLQIELNKPYKSEVKYYLDSTKSIAIFLDLPYNYLQINKTIKCHLDTCICAIQDYKKISLDLIIDKRLQLTSQKIQVPKSGFYILSKYNQDNKKNIFIESSINQIIKSNKENTSNYLMDTFQNINVKITNYINSLSTDSLIKTIKKEYGIIHIENKTTTTLTAELTNDRKLKYYFKLKPGENSFTIESSVYKSIIWDDSLNPNYIIDTPEPFSENIPYKTEKIYKNNLEITVNSKIENTITIDDNK